LTRTSTGCAWPSFEAEPASARLAVDLPDGRPLVAVDLPDGRPLVAVELLGDKVARLLAGEALAVPGYVAPSALVDEQRAVPVEPEQLEEPVPGGDETPELPADEYGTKLDEPPAGTEPIARPAQVEPPERVVAYVDGRWRDALVVSRGAPRSSPTSSMARSATAAVRLLARNEGGM
jgi:hypothetical protein